MPFPSLGKIAPAFSLKNQKGELVSLKDFRDKKNVVLYFYPKAMTPGCTVQACSLRDSKRKYSTKNTVILGVSPDSVERLVKFEEKEKLNFDLLADPDKKVIQKYGAWGPKKFMGKEFDGVLRTTFIIDKSGKLVHIMDKVATKTHHEDVLDWISKNLS